MPPLPDRLRSKCRPRELQENPAHQRALSASLKFKDYPLRGGGVCVCLSISSCVSLIVKSFASCVQQLSGSNQRLPRRTSTHSNPNLVLRCVPKLFCFVLFSHTSALLGKDHLKRHEAARDGIFFDPYQAPSTGPGHTSPR